MKYIKQFEENIDKPEIGDYVILFDIFHKDMLPYTNEQIGTFISHAKNRIDRYRIKYDNIPKHLINKFSTDNDVMITTLLSLNTINKYGYWSKNKKELETILQAKKYNL